MSNHKAHQDIIQKIKTRKSNRFIAMFIFFIIVMIASGAFFNYVSWSTSSDFHSAIELIGGLIGLLCGMGCIMYFIGFKNRFYLLIGIAFFIASSEDIIHGILSFERFFQNTTINFSKCVPATYVAGRLVLAILIIFAPLLEKKVLHKKRIIKESIGLFFLSLFIGILFTFLAFKIDLPKFIYPEYFISRPIDLLSSFFFLIALIIVGKRYLKKRDAFSGFLVATLLLNLGAGIYMAFSKRLYDAYFDLAHILKVFSYIVLIKGINVQMLRSTISTEFEFKKRLKTEKVLEFYKSFEKILMDFSKEFISFDLKDIDKGINRALKEVSILTKMDHSSIFLFNEDKRQVTYSYEWCKKGLESRIAFKRFKVMNVDQFPYITSKIGSLEEVVVPNIDSLPREAKEERYFLENDSVSSFIMLPLAYGVNIIGFVVFDSIKEHDVWDDHTVKLFRLLGDLCANVLKRKQDEQSLNNAKKEAEKVNKGKDKFIANMTHEIRTPLNAIIGISKVLVTKNESNLTQKQRQGIQLINKGGRRLLSLANDLLDISKIEEGKMQRHSSSFSINRLISDLSKTTRNLLLEKKVEFYIDKDFLEPDEIILDKEKLSQILLNLLSNAVKFTKKGRITLTMRTIESSKLYCEVKDTGIGINKKDLPYIFDRFKQTGDAIKEKGSGLGLALCKELVLFLEGEISTKSRLNHGTMISFCVPFKIKQKRKVKLEKNKVYS